MNKLIKSLYPVNYDKMVFIFSQKGMLMDIHVRMRGWGWIQYLGEKMYGCKVSQVQDDLGEFIAQAINEKIERELL